MLGLLLQIARVFALLSLVSIGGANAVLPEIRRQVVVVQGWMSDPAFANVFAISHAAPGPNIIMVSLIGWQLAGLAGLLVATLAIMIPSCTLAFVAGRAIAHWSERRWTKLLREGLVPLALGLILASGLSMMQVADHDAVTVAISLATAAFVILSRRNPLWAIVTGAAINIATLQFT
ncbi:MAG: chromate transporter [Proteobacteria bacterium]|nr:chromate transporter [Pseudomonadota bacterium]